MADGLNRVMLLGNLGADPELRFTASGQATATFGLAVNRRWQNRQTNEWEEQTSFFNVVAWREMAENVAESIGKGTRVVVTGRLEQRSWETENGEKRSVVEIVADEVGPSLRWATALACWARWRWRSRRACRRSTACTRSSSRARSSRVVSLPRPSRPRHRSRRLRQRWAESRSAAGG